ncbi:unnamed protein product [Mytilus coruscus]|uniref:WSC domain-containing protein n=1 Tax=Mytilus coruscus TaxID=42192 RepID=A0A6J8AWF6_MYTCO|nr:unnamed protein product [Mytilus coruscus]
MKFQSISVGGSETTMKTWKQAVLDCYGNNSFLESNITVLKTYMLNHTKVNDSIWVGSFGALLPWIEIRGCYNIPLTCNTLGMDEKNAASLQLCQLKCMKRRYFAFNQKNERCVCFDEHDVVEKETDNASFCQEFIHRGDSNTHAVVYKVFDRPITLASNNHDCLVYQCTNNCAMPVFSTKECYLYSRSYCRDGRRPDGNLYQHFFQYRGNCEENHFTYPLLYSENPVKLCNVSESLTPGIDVWVGVYRQKLYIDNLDKTVLQDFDKIEQYISLCDHLPTNNVFVKAENCSRKHHYKCTSDTPNDIQKEPYTSSTSTPVCQSGDPDTGNTDNQSSGIIAGTVTSMLVIVVIVVIVVFTYRRFNSKIPNINDNRSEQDPPKNNMYTQEENSEGNHRAIEITLGPNSFAKPLAANKTQVQKATVEHNEYSRIVSTVSDASNLTKKTSHCIANPGYNDLLLKAETKSNPNPNQQLSNSLTESMKSADYCVAKPITESSELSPYIEHADYDHLNSVKHQEKDSVNVYDHVPNIIDSDDTYDHSASNICKSSAYNYDHFDVQN